MTTLRDLFGPDLTIGEISAMRREVEKLIEPKLIPAHIEADFRQLLIAADLRQRAKDKQA